MKRRDMIAIALVIIVPFVLACGGGSTDPGSDDGPAGETTAEPKRTTQQKLITEAFCTAYSGLDLADYTACLDSLYTFEPYEGGDTQPAPWNLAEELRIAGRMFGGWTNPDGRTVDSITIQILPRTIVEDNTNYPPEVKPPGETWYKLTCFIELEVVAEDPADEEGYVEFLVLSDQIFTVRPDRDVDSLWTIFKQTDQAPVDKTRFPASTEQTTWTYVKRQFQ